MIWCVEKKVFHHFFDLGFESVEIPIRVKFEFEVRDGCLVSESLSHSILYNRPALKRRYPHLDADRFHGSIEKKVNSEIRKYMKACGYLKKENQE